MTHGSHNWIAWHFGIDQNRPLESDRQRRKRMKRKQPRTKQLDLLPHAPKLSEVRTMVGENYKPDPSHVGECPWDE